MKIGIKKVAQNTEERKSSIQIDIPADLMYLFPDGRVYVHGTIQTGLIIEPVKEGDDRGRKLAEPKNKRCPWRVTMPGGPIGGNLLPDLTYKVHVTATVRSNGGVDVRPIESVEFKSKPWGPPRKKRDDHSSDPIEDLKKAIAVVNDAVNRLEGVELRVELNRLSATRSRTISEEI